jgi:hypothetical protein
MSGTRAIAILALGALATSFVSIAATRPASAGGVWADVPTLRDEQAVSSPAEPETDPDAEWRRSLAELQDRFRSGYLAQGRPRMAVFVNRELSGDVREWNVVSGELEPESMSETRAGSDGTWSTTERVGGKAKHVHSGPAADGARHNVGESWLWEFEEAFLRPYLATSCRVVDRSVIVRLAAAQAAKTGMEYAGQAAKKIEMDALVDQADVLIEITATEDASAPQGYRMRASAKEVQSGRVIAVATSTDGEIGGIPRPVQFIAGPSGYERAQEPPIRDLAEGMAMLLMEQLADVWE